MVLLALGLGRAAGAQSGYPPRTDAYVDDIAQVIEPQDEAAIRQILEDLRATRGVGAAVVTIGSIGDYSTGDQTIESFATHLFNAWGLGDAQRNDGVLVLVAVDDRLVRIELGAGYDASYEARMRTVINEHFLNDFRSGRTSMGIVSGVRALVHELTGAWPALPGLPLATPVATVAEAHQQRSPMPKSQPDGLVVLAVLFFVGMGIYTVARVVWDAVGGRSTPDATSGAPDGDEERESHSLFDNSSLTGSSFDSSSSSSSSHSASGGGGRSSGGGVTGNW